MSADRSVCYHMLLQPESGFLWRSSVFAVQTWYSRHYFVPNSDSLGGQTILQCVCSVDSDHQVWVGTRNSEDSVTLCSALS